ncbi:hypothetical protein XINFAN_03807 [Pseudogemmobacter humi]|uniref:YjiS-like domain-containing protein n=1 Tax=Pseudogemmobacter humi TaxID=2483812 RepID=A0A3P5XF74_9RHOB|nr:hypothetical protein XINFAN_03807 [Pseudogemmobacter humi]
MQQAVIPSHSAARTPGRSAVARLLLAPGRGVAGWMDRYRSRKALSRLDDHLLQDIGLTRPDCTTEIEKPFWRA